VQSSSQIITTNKATPSFLQAGCPSCRPTNSVKALKKFDYYYYYYCLTGVSGRAVAVIRQRGVDTSPAVLTCDVTAVVNVDVTSVSAEAGTTEAHRRTVVDHTVGTVYGAGKAVRRTRNQLCQQSLKLTT